MYVKIVNGTPRYTSIPGWIKHNGNVMSNAPDNILKELGYYKVQETAMPTDAQEGQHYESQLEFADGVVKQVWTLADDPAIPEPEPTMTDLEQVIMEAINSD